VDKEELKRFFPEKWDLADLLPKDAPKDVVDKLLASAKEKGIDPNQAMRRLSLDTKDPVQRERVNEILWRVDERLRPGLEEKHGAQVWKTNDEILKETSKIVSGQELRKNELREKFGLDGVSLEHLNYQISIAEAKQGRELRIGEIVLLKDVIRDQGFIQTQKVEKSVSDLVTDKALTAACEKALYGSSLNDLSKKREVSVQSLTLQVEKQIGREIVLGSDERKGPGKDIGMNI
jgi:hypothetical protein